MVFLYINSHFFVVIIVPLLEVLLWSIIEEKTVSRWSADLFYHNHLFDNVPPAVELKSFPVRLYNSSFL